MMTILSSRNRALLKEIQTKKKWSEIISRKNNHQQKINCIKTQFIQVVQANSAKADQNPFVLRTPGILENLPERSAKPNCNERFSCRPKLVP